MSALASFSAGFLISFFGALLIVRIPRLNSVASISPTANRWHRQVTPGLGGIPMFLGFIFAAGIAGPDLNSPGMAILAGTCLLFLVGVFDDLRGLGAKWKLLAQIVAASVVVLPVLSGYAVAELHWYHALPVLLWLVTIANGINLLDNMDGLAAGISLIATVAITILMTGNGAASPAILIMLTGLMGAIAGFLVLNINPAKLFMGDSGSQWLGLAVGAFSLLPISATANFDTSVFWYYLIPILILSVPLLDTSFVMVTRKLRGQAVSQGGRDHLSHRLVSLGCSERTSVAILWLFGIAGAVVALTSLAVQTQLWILLLLVYLICIVALINGVLRVSVSRVSEP